MFKMIVTLDKATILIKSLSHTKGHVLQCHLKTSISILQLINCHTHISEVSK